MDRHAPEIREIVNRRSELFCGDFRKAVRGILDRVFERLKIFDCDEFPAKVYRKLQ